MLLKNRRFLIVGFARSGLAAACFLMERGARVTITDLKSREELLTSIERLPGPAELVLGEHRRQDFLGADVIVLSPGVPASIAPLREADAQGVPILAEAELAFRHLKGPVVGVTGSNGKTTTTSWIGHILQGSDRDSVVAGNIGLPLIQAVSEQTPGQERIHVVELSSFQLETIEQFHCQIALLLNLTADHMDRYDSFEDYFRAKQRIFLNQGAGDFAILNLDDPALSRLAGQLRAQIFPFSRSQQLEEGAFVRQGWIICRQGGNEHSLMPVEDLPLKGEHNLENALAAASAAFLLDLAPEVIRQGLAGFQGVEHRIEWCGTLQGVSYYNDSKATNVDSAAKALQAFDTPLILIMGGLDKGGDFRSLRPLVE
ncbi:MAG: UDP-N-acetylmuramoyl-L-alanine--D-glutamate ligase, partial [Acidobacteriota bacterium]